MSRWTLAATIVLALGGGCAETSSDGADGSGLSVVAAFYPLAEAAGRIGGDLVDVTDLTPPGAEPHDIELTTDQLDQIIDADVVVYLGRGFQPALEEAVGLAQGAVLDVLEGETLIEGEDEPFDPHVWLDPQRWAVAVERIGDALIEADPDGADAFGNGILTYAGEIDDLDDEFEEGLASCERDLIVTSHASFGYMALRYGLEQESISGVTPEAEPDPEHLAELADIVEGRGVTTIYTETLVSPDVAQTLARETGVEVATLNPIEGLTSEETDDGEDYVSVMRENLDALREGLGCG